MTNATLVRLAGGGVGPMPSPPPPAPAPPAPPPAPFGTEIGERDGRAARYRR